jgi:hypothetical protein
MTDQSTSNRDTVASRVIDRATRDPQFRQELLRNPATALEQELGMRIPESIEIRVVEETPSTLYLVLPPQRMAAGEELSDRDLERVTGGWGGPDTDGCPM